MKKLIVLTWTNSGKLFGVYTDKNEMDLAVTATASEVKCTTELLKSYLTITELEPNKVGKV